MVEDEKPGEAPREASITKQEDDVVESVILRRRPMWPFAAVFGGLVAILGGFIYWKSTRPEPLRVLVAIDVEGVWWEGSRPAAELADEVAELLKKVGFEPVKGGDPEVDKILSSAKSPEDAARSLKAAFVITGTLKPEYVEYPIAGGYTEVRIDAPITIRNISDGPGKAEERRVSTWSGAREKEKALSLITDSLASNVFAEASTVMMDHPTIATLIASDDIKTLSQLQDAKAYVTRKAEKLDRARRAYELVEKEHREAAQMRPITYHSSWSADDALAGASTEGTLVRTRGVRPFVSPRSPDLKYNIDLETLAWRGADGTDKTIWKGYHLYSYPSAAAAGAPIVFVEDIFGWAKTLTVVDAGGAAKRIRIEPEIRFVDPKIANGGKFVATYQKSCQRCDTVFSLLSATDGKTLYLRGDVSTSSATEGTSAELTTEGETFGGFAWLDENRAILSVRRDAVVREESEEPKKKRGDDEAADPLARILVIDASRPETKAEMLVPLDDESRYGAPAVSPDRKLIAICRSTVSGSDLALVDVEKKSISNTGAATGCSDPTFSPDGALVAFSNGSDIGLYRVAASRSEVLTKNDDRERYPSFSFDGKRVLFETLRADPIFQTRGVSVISSVAVDP